MYYLYCCNTTLLEILFEDLSLEHLVSESMEILVSAETKDFICSYVSSNLPAAMSDICFEIYDNI